MRHVILLSVLLIVGLFVQGQTTDKNWAIGAWVGGYYGDKLEGAGLLTELYVSRYLNPSFDGILLNNNGLINSETDELFDMGTIFLNLKYKFNNGYLLEQNSLVAPYLFAGPGWIWDNNSSSLNFDAGVGVNFVISPRLTVFTEAGYISGLASSNNRNDGSFNESFFKVVAGVEIGLWKNRMKYCHLDERLDGHIEASEVEGISTTVRKDFIEARDNGDMPKLLDNQPAKTGTVDFKGCVHSIDDQIITNKVDSFRAVKGCKDEERVCAFAVQEDVTLNVIDEKQDVSGAKLNDGHSIAQKVDTITWVAQDILFDNNSSYLRTESYFVLNRVVKFLKDNEMYTLSVSGYTDSVGTTKYNRWLSDRRANTVKKYLVTHGIDSGRLETKGYGEEQPVDTNATEEGRANNRRAELILY